MSENNQELNINVITEEEKRLAFKEPAVYVDHFYMSLNGPMARLAFCELVEGTQIKIPRSTITLPIHVLAKFGAFALQILEQQKQQGNLKVEGSKIEGSQ